MGMLSSSLGQLVAYPLSLVRARLQAQGAGGAPAKYAGMTDVLVKVRVLDAMLLLVTTAAVTVCV